MSRGVLLAGGSGQRLRPITNLYNKHFILVYNKPAIYYSLSLLIGAGCDEILVVRRPEDRGLFDLAMGTGEQWGIRITYQEQERPRTPVDALLTAEGFCAGATFVMLLGDNIFLGEETPHLVGRRAATGRPCIFLEEVPDPSHYGVALVERDQLMGIEEKPTRPASKLAVTGLYVYDSSVFERARQVGRDGNISQVNDSYLREGLLDHTLVDGHRSWYDAGKPLSLLEAAAAVRDFEERRGHPVGCPYWAAFGAGRLSAGDIEERVESFADSDYGRLLLDRAQRAERRLAAASTPGVRRANRREPS